MNCINQKPVIRAGLALLFVVPVAWALVNPVEKRHKSVAKPSASKDATLDTLGIPLNRKALAQKESHTLPVTQESKPDTVQWVSSAVNAKSKIKGVSVKVGRVVLKDIAQTVPSLGSLAATQFASLSALSDGQVTNIYFKNGQAVADGMPIIQLDDSQQKANLDKAKTDFELEQLKYDRSKQLQNEAFSAQQIAALKADVDKFKASKKAAFAALQQRKVTAPFSGTLSSFKVNVGDYVSQGASLVKLVNNKQLRIDFRVPEVYKPKLQTGQMVKVSSAAYPKKTFIGTVDFVSPLVQDDTRSVAVQALLPNNKALLSPGMFVKVLLTVGTLKNAVVVPDQAVSADIKGYFVYRIDGNIAKQVYITLGQRSSDLAQVLSGLKKGDTVVTAGQQKLEEGSVVSVDTSH